MSSATYVGPRLKAFESTPQFDGYTKVVISVADGIEISSGNDLGRTLRVNNPWGTQEIADNILALVRGFQYQPYSASSAQVEPAAELGDGITVSGVYSGLYKQSTRYGKLFLSDIAAPTEHALDHEYPYKSRPNKEITRETRILRSSLRVQANRITAEIEARESDVESLNSQLEIQAGLIEARVTKTGGNASSFGWTLDESSWTIQANNQDVLRATESGLEIHGKVIATSGKIGGFSIESTYLSYNNQVWGGTNRTGIYLGINGIQLGNKFKVDNAGNLNAASGTFTGTVHAGNIAYGGNAGYFNGGGLVSGSVGGGWGGQIGTGTIGTMNTTGGINTSLGYADFSNGVFNGWNQAGYIKATYGYFSFIAMGGYTYSPKVTRVMGPNGETPIYIYYLGRD